MVFSLKSSGVRRAGIRAEHYGFLEMIGSELWILPFDRTKNVAFAVETEYNLIFESKEKVDNMPLDTELSIVMIDDGDKMRAQFYIEDKLMCEISADSVKNAQHNRIAFCNREHDGNDCDITYLQLSIID